MDTIVTLLEHFNTSNQTSPHFERHENFVEDIIEPDCGLVSLIKYKTRCKFVMEDDMCTDVFFIDYYHLLYCRIGSEKVWKVTMFISIVTFLLLLMYSIMTSASTKFFCPSISVFAHKLGLSENVAGVTILAFANGANDFIAGFAGSNKTTRLYYTDTFGSNLVLVNLVAGGLLIFQPFTMHSYNYLRDVSFLLLYSVTIDYFFQSEHKVTLVQAYLLLVLYIAYISTVIIEHFLIKDAKRRFKPDELRGSISRTLYLKHLNDFGPIIIKTKKSHEMIDISSAPPSFEFMFPRNHNLWKHMWESLDPIHYEEWKTKKLLLRIYYVIIIPHMFLLNFMLPVVDFEERRRGWSKLLNCIQIVILPLFLVYINIPTTGPFDEPICLYTLLITVPLSVYIFMNTRTQVTPYHHTYMSVLTLIGASTVVYSCALEILAIFDVIGVITGCSNTFIGATLLAWSNCFNDLLSNFILAQQGHVEMSFSACFGTAIWNCMATLAFFVMYNIYHSPNYEVSLGIGTTGETVSLFLIISLACLLFGASTTNFRLRRSLGIFMFMIYIIFFVATILGELELIHTYGSDHRFDKKMRFNRLDANIEEKYDIRPQIFTDNEVY